LNKYLKADSQAKPTRQPNIILGDVGAVSSASKTLKGVPVKIIDSEQNPEDHSGKTRFSFMEENMPTASILMEDKNNNEQDASAGVNDGTKIALPEASMVKDEQVVQENIGDDTKEISEVPQFFSENARQNKIIYTFQCKVCDYDEENQFFYKGNIPVVGRLYGNGQMTLHMIGNEECLNPHLKWNINIKAAVINTGLAAREGDIYMIGQNWASVDRLGEKRILVLRFRQKGEGNGGWRAAGFEVEFQRLQKRLGVALTVEDEYDGVDELTQASQHIEYLLPGYTEAESFY